MQCYEADVKKPIRGLLKGELARTLLIQVRPALAVVSMTHAEHGGCLLQ